MRASVIWLAALCLAAVLAGVLPMADPADTRAGVPLAGPTWSNPLGTDQLGRDLLARVVHGARISLMVAIAAVGLSSGVGTALGVLAGVRRGNVERSIMFGADVLLAVPALLLALLLVSVTESRGIGIIAVAIAAIYLGATVRVIRGVTLTIASRTHVTALRAVGAGEARIIVREVLPNVLPTVIALASVAMAGAVVTEGALAYLGLSVSPPTSTWGAMMSSGLGRIDQSVYPVAVPSVFMFLTVLSLTIVGDHLHGRDGDGARR